MRTLRKGISGPDVVEIQQFFGLKSHGLFDDKLKSVVQKWQKRKRLEDDGVVGPQTWKTLGKQPASGPQSKRPTEDDIRAIIEANAYKLTTKPEGKNSTPIAFDPNEHVIVVAIRGFNLDMGRDNENDRRMYDDAHFIVTPRGMVSFRGNTDPNGYRKGSGFGKGKGMACLKEGVWFYGKGDHKGRPSFRQAVPFTVIRDGDPPYPHTGYFGINWHSGGYSSTSSLGCQTNKPDDFSKLRNYIYDAMEDFDNPKMYTDRGLYQRVVPYILIEEKQRRRGNLEV